ncbi:LysR family transcriptional regulator [Vibrio quintilis]|uniref:HTH-type transcriptional regulator CysL n=1 Tax=Vibrio quintilis TaxID=1117707 RepID=A0A1M7Z2Y4_9VIBR|nr:LysR family transcriptional regulator [Vibrio quintilis]SHO59253.1 HTH-type transcriptional regulator CysL [Vibrio quintilis]
MPLPPVEETSLPEGSGLPDYSLKEIRAFNATVQHGNFTRAAEALQVSQPAITAQIHKLESRFEYPLLERFSRGVRLTEFGQQLYKITCQFQDLDSALDLLCHPDREPGGMTLRIANASSLIFMPVLAGFSREYPSTRLKINSATTTECIQQLLAREADIGLFPLREPNPALSRLTFASHRLIALLKSDHPLAALPELSITDIVREPLIFYKPGACTQQVIDTLLDIHQIQGRSNIIVDSRLDVTEAVRHNLGIGFALARDIRPEPEIVMRPIMEATEDVDEHIVWLKHRSTLPGLRTFIQYALEVKCREL